MTLKHSIRLRTQAGLTLVELMIAITLSLIIVGAVMAVYLTSSTTYRVNRNLAVLQNDARYGIGTLSQQLREAGYDGCLNNMAVPRNDLNAPGTQYGLDYGQWVDGFEYAAGSWTQPINPAITTALASATPPLYATTGVGAEDILVVRRADPSQAVSVQQNSAPGSASITVSSPNSLYPGEIVLVTDCASADIFQVTGPTNPSIAGVVVHNTGSSQTPGNAIQGFSADYNTDAQILPIATVAYVVAAPAAGAGAPAPIPSLWSVNLTANPGTSAAAPALLAPDVVAMRVFYGEDTDGDHAANEYVDLTTALAMDPQLNNVVSLRLVLLFVTAEDNLTSTISPVNNFPSLGNTYTPTDHRLYRVFSTTIALRERTH